MCIYVSRCRPSVGLRSPLDVSLTEGLRCFAIEMRINHFHHPWETHVLHAFLVQKYLLYLHSVVQVCMLCWYTKVLDLIQEHTVSGAYARKPEHWPHHEARKLSAPSAPSNGCLEFYCDRRWTRGSPEVVRRGCVWRESAAEWGGQWVPVITILLH